LPFSKSINSKIILDEVILITSEGEMVSCTEEYGEIVISSKWNDSMILVDTFNKSEKWFYDGKKLLLNITIRMKNGDEWIETELSYNVTIKGYKGTRFQV
jgi:hypothetical protein